MGVEPFVALPLRPAPRRGWGSPSRRRIGPLRTVAEGGRHPILSAILSGALVGLAAVVALGLPAFLVLSVKSPPTPEIKALATIKTPADVRVWVESRAAPIGAASADPAPIEPTRAGEARPILSLDLIPVLDDASGASALEAPSAKPAGSPPAPRAARTP